MFYNSIIKSVLLFNIMCSVGNLPKQDKKKLERPRKIAQRIIGAELDFVDCYCTEQIVDKVCVIMKRQYPSTSSISFILIVLVSDFAPPQLVFHDSDIHLSPTLFINSTQRFNVEFKRQKLILKLFLIWNTNDQCFILKLYVACICSLFYLFL